MLPVVTTKIQLMTERLYKVIAIHPFLYQPADDSKIINGDKEYRLTEISDIIDINGDITRYVRYR